MHKITAANNVNYHNIAFEKEEFERYPGSPENLHVSILSFIHQEGIDSRR